MAEDKPPHYEIDNVDRGILNLLLSNARTSFLEVARKLNVSGGTVHQRVDKMKAAGVITGSTLRVNHERLGLGVTVLLGVHLHKAQRIAETVQALRSLPEIVEAYYTTGNYALFVKLHVSSIKAYHEFLVDRLQCIDSIRFTESFICLDMPIDRSSNLTAIHSNT